MNKICCVYKITNPLGRIYIGQTVHFKNRMSCYKNGHYKNQPRLKNSFKKYGWDAHNVEILQECLRADLDRLEVYYIELYNTFDTENGLNLHSGGKNNRRAAKESLEKSGNSLRGRVVSSETRKLISERVKQKLIDNPEIRKKISEAGRGRIVSEATRQKHRNRSSFWLGKKMPASSREKMSLAKKGKTPWNKGIPITEELRGRLRIMQVGFKHTEASRKKISDSNKGKKVSPESVKKSSDARRGKKRTPEQKERMRLGRIGVKMSDAARHNLSIARKGRKFARRKGHIVSDETRKKISEANKKSYQSSDRRDRLSAAHKGKTLTLEHRMNLSSAHMGKKLSEEHKNKVSLALKGRVFSAEHRANLSLAEKRKKEKKEIHE